MPRPRPKWAFVFWRDAAAAIRRYRDDHARRRRIGDETELAQLRDALGETSAHA